MCSTPGTWSPDNCSLRSSADVAPDDWHMLTPRTWCPGTSSLDTRKCGSSPDVTSDDWFTLEQHILEFWTVTNTSLTVHPLVEKRNYGTLPDKRNHHHHSWHMLLDCCHRRRQTLPLDRCATWHFLIELLCVPLQMRLFRKHNWLPVWKTRILGAE